MRRASRNPRVSGVEGALIDRKSLAASSDSGVSCQTAPSFEVRGEAAAVVVVDLHVEAAGAPRHRAPDSPHPEDSEAFPGHVHAEHHRGVPAHPLAGPHHPVAFGTAPGRSEQAEHRDVGGGVVEDIGRVGHDDAPRLRRVHRDVLVADRVGGEDPDAVGESFDDSRGQRVAAGAEDPVLALAGLQEAVRAVDAVFGVERRVVVAREPRLDVGRHAAGAENPVLVGHGAAFLPDSLLRVDCCLGPRRQWCGAGPPEFITDRHPRPWVGECRGLVTAPVQPPPVGSSDTFTTSLPKFSPRSRPRNAPTALSMPSTTSSR